MNEGDELHESVDEGTRRLAAEVVSKLPAEPSIVNPVLGAIILDDGLEQPFNREQLTGKAIDDENRRETGSGDDRRATGQR